MQIILTRKDAETKLKEKFGMSISMMNSGSLSNEYFEENES